jgi:uncharacterized protein (TIRG00374 family)
MGNLSAGVREEDGRILLSGWRYRAAAASVLLAAVGYLGLGLWSGWAEVTVAISKVGVFGITVALALSLVNYGLRFARWQMYLRAMGHEVPGWHSLRIYIAGFALTTTPGKVGEALRGVLLKRWKVPFQKSLAAFLSERLSDLLAIVLLTLFGLAIFPSARTYIAVGGSAVVATLFMLANQNLLQWLHGLVLRHARIPRVVIYGVETLLQARRCHAPAVLASACALSLVAWGAEAWAFHLILDWVGIAVPLAFAVFVYALAMLAGALSFMPGGLGGAEAVMVALLVWKGSSTPDAVAATLIIRLTTLWFAVVLGGFAVFGYVFETRRQNPPGPA